jgi:hypothetical protein
VLYWLGALTDEEILARLLALNLSTDQENARTVDA